MIITKSISATPQTGITEPVTLDEVKAWANIDIDDDDELLTDMIEGARQDIEGETSLKLVPHDVVYNVELTESGTIYLPYGDATVDTFEEYDSDGDLSTVDADYYFGYGNNLQVSTSGNFKISYTVGVTAPQALKEAIMMLVAYRYKNRGSQEKQTGFPEDIARKISKYTQVWL